MFLLMIALVLSLSFTLASCDSFDEIVDFSENKINGDNASDETVDLSEVTIDFDKIIENLPKLDAPVKGEVIKPHSTEVQIYNTTMQDYRVHIGVDIKTADGELVRAAADGTVDKIWYDDQMGYCISIVHGERVSTVYKNLSENSPVDLAEGASVKRGDVIAAVGNTAPFERADEYHLHFEMLINDICVDPQLYFSFQ